MIRAIAIDLDDTLLDTSGLLVPAASRNACHEMIRLGLQCSLEECLQAREELALHHSHREIFPLIAKKYHAPDQAAAAQAGIFQFYHHPNLPARLPLMEGADEVLTTLAGRYRLYLVTAGIPEAQMRKIQAAGLHERFVEIFTVDNFKGARKKAAFESILVRENLHPSQLLSIGNRLREEIRQAKECGAQTCYFEYGEHVGEIAQKPEDKPDFIIRHWKDFIPTCRL